MTKEEILAAAGYPNTPEGIAAFYNEYNTPDAFFAKHGGSLSGAPHDGQPTADQFFNYGSHVNDKLNVPMSNPFFLKQGGTYYGGPTRPYAYGGDITQFCWGGGLPGGPNEMPEMLEGGYMQKGGTKKVPYSDALYPLKNKSDSLEFKKAYELGTKHGPYVEHSTLFPKGDKNYSNAYKSGIFQGTLDVIKQKQLNKHEDGGFYIEGGYNSPMNYGSFPVTSEYGGILDASNRDAFPMMEHGGANLSKIIKAASKKMKKAYASGGNTTIQGGNQNFLENRNNAFTNSIKNNVYNAFIKEEEKAAMQALNPYATGMEQDDQEYPEARYGLSTYRKKGEKQPDDVPIDFRKALPDLFPVGRDYSQYIPANIQSQYFMSNADYAKMYDLNKRLGDKTFNLTGFEGTPEYGPMARLLGKTGRKIFGPKSVTYKFTGRGVKQVPVKDTELNMQNFEKNYGPREADYRKYEGPFADENKDNLPDYLTTSGIQKMRYPNPYKKATSPTSPNQWYYFDDTTSPENQVPNYEWTYDPSLVKKSDENIQKEKKPSIIDKINEAKDNLKRRIKNVVPITDQGAYRYGGISSMYQDGGLTWEQYDDLKAQYAAAQQASLKNKRNDETLKFQQSFHSYEPTRQIAEGLLAERQAANQPTALGRTLGKDKMYSLASNEDKYFGNTTQQYLAELEKLKPKTPRETMQPRQVSLDTNFTGDIAQSSFIPQSTTTPAPTAQPKPQVNTLQASGTNLTDMNVQDSPVDLKSKTSTQQVNALQSSKPTMGNVNAGDTGLSDADKKAAIVNKAKNFPTGKLTPDKPNMTEPTDTEVGPEETITSKIKRKTKGIVKAIGQYAPGAANAWASILEKQNKMDPMQNQPVVLGNRGDYDINTGDFRVHQKVPVQFPGGPGAYRMEYGGIPKALSGLEVKMRPGLYGTNGNRQFSLPTQVDSQKFAQQPTEVRGSLTAVPRDQANLEAEGGETAMVNIDGIPAHFDIKGKRHSQGGVPLDLPDNSFIFSDTASMRIKDPNVQKDFGLPIKKGGYTPAEIAKKYDINKFRKILSDPNSEDLERKTAEGMIANYNMKLAKLSLIQESMKGFPQGVPVVAMPYMMANNVDPSMYMPTQGQEEQPDEDMGVQRYGGNIVAQYPTMRYGGLPKAQQGKNKVAQPSYDELYARQQKVLQTINDIIENEGSDAIPEELKQQYTDYENLITELYGNTQAQRDQFSDEAKAKKASSARNKKLGIEEESQWINSAGDRFDEEGNLVQDHGYFNPKSIGDYFGRIGKRFSGDMTQFAPPPESGMGVVDNPGKKKVKQFVSKLNPANAEGVLDYAGNIINYPLYGVNNFLTGQWESTGNLYTDVALDPTTWFGVKPYVTPFQYGKQAVKYIAKYGPDVAAFIQKHGKRAYEIIEKYGEAGVEAVKKYGKKGIDYVVEKAPILAEKIGKALAKPPVGFYTNVASRGIQGYAREQEKDKKVGKLKAENQILREELERVTQQPDAVTTTTTTPIVDIKKAKPAPVKPKATGNVKDAMDNMNRFAGYKQPMSYEQFRQGLPVYERPAAALPEIQSKPSAPVKDIEVKKKPQGSKQTKKVVEKPKKEEKIDWSQFKEQ